MSKNTKARKHAVKMARKKAEKMARKAKYEALKGTSKKKKRQGKKSKVSGTYKHAHIMSNCGNPGCKKCHHLLVGQNHEV